MRRLAGRRIRSRISETGPQSNIPPTAEARAKEIKFPVDQKKMPRDDPGESVPFWKFPELSEGAFPELPTKKPRREMVLSTS